MYKEPVDLMKVTCDSIARQKWAKKNICVVVGMEERTPDVEQKKADLMQTYEGSFLHFMVTIHPKGVIGKD